MLIRALVATAALLILSACTEDAEVGDLPGYVDSIGPASFEDGTLTIPFSTWDEDGDAVDVDVALARGDGAFETIAVLEELATEAATSTAQTFLWDELAPDDVNADLTIRMFVVDRPEAALTLGPFTPATLGDD